MFHAVSAAFTVRTRRAESGTASSVLPAARPTRGSGLGASARIAIAGDGAAFGDGEVDAPLPQAAKAAAPRPIPRSLLYEAMVGSVWGMEKNYLIASSIFFMTLISVV